MKDEQFYDGDKFLTNKNGTTFDGIVIKQIQQCCDLLSVEKTHARFVPKLFQGRELIIYQKSEYKNVIESVDTLRSLLLGKFDKEMKVEDEKIKKEKEDLLNYLKIRYRISDRTTFLDKENPMWLEYDEKMCEISRKLFLELMNLYHRMSDTDFIDGLDTDMGYDDKDDD